MWKEEAEWDGGFERMYWGRVEVSAAAKGRRKSGMAVGRYMVVAVWISDHRWALCSTLDFQT